MFKLALLVGIASTLLWALETKARMKDLPEVVQNTVNEQTKGATLKGISKQIENGKTYYEAETVVIADGSPVRD